MMDSRRSGRRLIIVAGGAAIIALGSLTAACGKTEKEAPSSTTTPTTATSPAPAPTSAAPAPAPTEKQINPTGGNLFTPTVLAPPAPTQPPGVHRNGPQN